MRRHIPGILIWALLWAASLVVAQRFPLIAWMAGWLAGGMGATIFHGLGATLAERLNPQAQVGGGE